jgi:hypothetical protein
MLTSNPWASRTVHLCPWRPKWPFASRDLPRASILAMHTPRLPTVCGCVCVCEYVSIKFQICTSAANIKHSNVYLTASSRCEYARSCTHTNIHTNMHTCIHTYVRNITHLCMYKIRSLQAHPPQARIDIVLPYILHTYIHTYIHTYMDETSHTCACIRSGRFKPILRRHALTLSSPIFSVTVSTPMTLM